MVCLVRVTHDKRGTATDLSKRGASELALPVTGPREAEGYAGR